MGDKCKMEVKRRGWKMTRRMSEGEESGKEDDEDSLSFPLLAAKIPAGSKLLTVACKKPSCGWRRKTVENNCTSKHHKRRHAVYSNTDGKL